jgi:uncharacterized protein YodC (DUF2158 family)
MIHEFEAGDVVQLKSGGPKMTVELLTNEDGNVIVHCSWFEKSTLHQKDFNAKLLAQYKPAVGCVSVSRG